MRLSWDWTWWIWRGAQRAMAVVMVSCVDDLGFTSFPHFHGPFESCVCSRHSYLTLMAVWEYSPLQKPLKSSRKGLTLPLRSPTQPRAAGFARSVKTTGLQCTMRVAVGAGVLFPETLPALKNRNVINSPLLFFSELLNCGLHLYLVMV